MTEFEYKNLRASIEEKCTGDLKALDRVYAIARGNPVQIASIVENNGSISPVHSKPKRKPFKKTGAMAAIRAAVDAAGNEFKVKDVWPLVTMQIPGASRANFDNHVYLLRKMGLLERIAPGHYKRIL